MKTKETTKAAEIKEFPGESSDSVTVPDEWAKRQLLLKSADEKLKAAEFEVQKYRREIRSLVTEIPRLMTAKEVSEATGLSLQRVYSLVRSGHLPHVRLGKAIRFSVPQFLDWLAKGGSGGKGSDS